MNIERGDAERLQMRRPRVSIGEALGRVGCEHADHGTRQIALAHVGEARLVDEMRRVAGVEQVQEVQPALRARGDERRELVIADLRGDEVLGLVPCAGVVDRNPRCVGRRRQVIPHELDGSMLPRDPDGDRDPF